jgi:hypothetical protein
VNGTLFLKQGRELENIVSLEYLLLKEKGPLGFPFYQRVISPHISCFLLYTSVPGVRCKVLTVY